MARVALTRGLARVALPLVALALIVTAVAAAAPWAVRKLTLHYLDRAGIHATIGNVDVNPLTGRVEYDELAGDGADGGGFLIGRLVVSLDYAPLLSKHLRLRRLAIDDAALDVRRSADHRLHVAGVALPKRGAAGSGSDWRVGLEALAISNTRLRYRQPGAAGTAVLERTLVIRRAKAHKLIPWQPHSDVPLEADLRSGDSGLRLSGRARPFAVQPSAHLELGTDGFALALLDPLFATRPPQTLSGTLEGKQSVDIEYRPDAQLSIALDGHTRWRRPRLALAGDAQAAGKALAWRGTLDLALLHAGGQPAQVDAQGELGLDGVSIAAGGLNLSQKSLDFTGEAHATLTANTPRARLNGKLQAAGVDMKLAGGLTISAKTADWQGKGEWRPGNGQDTAPRAELGGDIRFASLRIARNGVALAASKPHWQGDIDLASGTDGRRIQTNGTLRNPGTTLNTANGAQVTGRALSWQGQTDTRVAAGQTTIDSRGRLALDRIDAAQPDTAELEAHALRVDGQTHTSIADGAVHFESGADLGTAAARVAHSGGATLTTGQLDWSGDTRIDAGASVAASADGRLMLTGPRLALAARPLAVHAKRLVFTGRYAQSPQLTVDGDIDAQAFAATNTALHAPWLALRQFHAAGLAIAGPGRIGFERLTGYGLRVLGDTDTPVAVLTAVSVRAKSFRLDDLRHYRLADLTVDDVNIRLRRDAGGMGVIARYLATAGGGDQPSPGPAPTLALDHLAISGPALAFTDVSVDPTVRLSGANLSFSMTDLDTARPRRDASYRLSLDVGAYGHIDSRGKIAPLHPAGIQMDLDAWIRSLSLRPLSGYMNAALGRRIVNGVADGTLALAATDGQLDGVLDTTLSNFRLAPDPDQSRTIAFGITLDQAVDLVRRGDNVINFKTLILGDATNPAFSIKNLTREAILAGLRTALTSDYSPLGLLNKAKNAILDLGRPLAAEPVGFAAGKHYIRPEERGYLRHIAEAMRARPELDLSVEGHAVPADIKALPGGSAALRQLAEQRARAVRDYLAARDVSPDRIRLREPVVDRGANARPRARLAIEAR